MVILNDFPVTKVNPDLVNYILVSVTSKHYRCFPIYAHLKAGLHQAQKFCKNTYHWRFETEPFASYSKSHRHMKASFKCKQYVHRKKVNSQEKKKENSICSICVWQIYDQIGRYPKSQYLCWQSPQIYLPSRELQLKTAWWVNTYSISVLQLSTHCLWVRPSGAAQYARQDLLCKAIKPQGQQRKRKAEFSWFILMTLERAMTNVFSGMYNQPSQLLNINPKPHIIFTYQHTNNGKHRCKHNTEFWEKEKKDCQVLLTHKNPSNFLKGQHYRTSGLESQVTLTVTVSRITFSSILVYTFSRHPRQSEAATMMRIWTLSCFLISFFYTVTYGSADTPTLHQN